MQAHTPPLLAIATCEKTARLTPGDQLLAKALNTLGIATKPMIWRYHRAWEDFCSSPSPSSATRAVVIRSTWDYHQHPREFLQWIESLSQRRITLINSAEVLRWNIDKKYLLQLAARGQATVPTILIKKDTPLDQALAELQQNTWPTVVLKPTVSASSALTYKISREDQNQIINALHKIKAHSDILVQPYIEAIETTGEFSLIFFKEYNRPASFQYAVVKKPKSNEFRVQSEFGGSLELTTVGSQFIDLALDHLSVVPSHWAFARVDLINHNGKPLLSELELIEPDLYLDQMPQCADPLARAIASYLGNTKRIR